MKKRKKKVNSIRYTQKTRSFDKKTKLYTQKRNDLEKQYKSSNPKIQEYQDELAEINHKSCTVSEFEKYINKKIKVKI